jgi:hypothetical protein
MHPTARPVSRFGSPRSVSNGVRRRTSRTVTSFTAAKTTFGRTGIQRPCTSWRRSAAGPPRAATAERSSTSEPYCVPPVLLPLVSALSSTRTRRMLLTTCRMRFIGTRVHSARRRSSLVTSATSSSATTPAGSKPSTGCATRARKWPVLPLARAGRGRSGVAEAPRDRAPARRRDRVASADRRALDARRPARARGRGRNERELQRLTGRMGAETTASSGVSRMRLPAT